MKNIQHPISKLGKLQEAFDKNLQVASEVSSVWYADLCSKLPPKLVKKYFLAFAPTYCATYTTAEALQDIENLEASPHHDLHLKLLATAEPNIVCLKFFNRQRTFPLASVLTILENLGLTLAGIQSYTINAQSLCTTVNAFNILWEGDSAAILKIQDLLCDTIYKILLGSTENDRFNQLVFLGKDLREVAILRAYAKYLHQICFNISQDYIVATLRKNTAVTHAIFALFAAKFDPSQAQKPSGIKKLQDTITSLLQEVTVFEEDKVLRQLVALINATVRTNCYRNKNCLAFKFNAALIPELPLPHPLYEIFVYAMEFEGIHLRMGKIARGGLRWSERNEDFRTEILGLMKAQQVKNVIIVPNGAKGGFVLKQVPAAEVTKYYQRFISGLLDLTDNIVNGKIVPPPDTICYDEPDPYLVVAADKGTANFSNLANQVAAEYHFWLQDAFASGGATGYSHKAIGITARGAWESAKHHFSILGINPACDPFTVIGIGDMSGDVFGNGVLLSPTLKLVAAFDGKHIFLDPNPDPASSFQERSRLFALGTSSWEDYNQELISPGGGVYARSAKTIMLSKEVQKALRIKITNIAPHELIKVLLKAPVDLLWMGGIGTYVKASSESHADVNDVNNNLVRIDAQELRCKSIAEGANLGLTQLARIEYAKQGGLINTDFIDNSGGVDCSDHEVNIKILLNELVTKKLITTKQRNKLLVSMTDEVAALVLATNYAQTRIISIIAKHSPQLIDVFIDCMERWEHAGKLNRELEFLPSNKELLERKTKHQGLTRPEVAVLLAYSKMILKEALLKRDFITQPCFFQYLVKAFPPSLVHKFNDYLVKHRLRQEIIATQLSNDFTNNLGITFIQQIHKEMLVSLEDIVSAYVVVSKLFALDEVKKTIAMQEDLAFRLHLCIKQAIRWFLRNAKLPIAIDATINKYAKKLALVGTHSEGPVVRIEHMVKMLNIFDIAVTNDQEVVKITKIYLALLDALDINWLSEQILNCPLTNSWSLLAKNNLHSELDALQKTLAIDVAEHYQKDSRSQNIVQQWLRDKELLVARWQLVISEMRKADVVEFNILYVAVKELCNIVNRFI